MDNTASTLQLLIVVKKFRIFFISNMVGIVEPNQLQFIVYEGAKRPRWTGERYKDSRALEKTPQLKTEGKKFNTE
jgi:hypothetical protein